MWKYLKSLGIRGSRQGPQHGGGEQIIADNLTLREDIKNKPKDGKHQPNELTKQRAPVSFIVGLVVLHTKESIAVW